MEQVQNKPRTSAKDFFFYFVTMVLLYTNIFALINLLFTFINYSYPDAINTYYDPFSTAVRWAIAMLIILFPAFLAGTWLINRDLRAHPEKEDIGIRKWLTYLALAVATVGILIDLSVLVYSFLGGEITARFILKTLVVLVVAAVVFVYYMLDLRGKIMENSGLAKSFGAGVLLLVLVSVGSGFAVSGTPATQRELRFDSQRISDLQNIQWQMVNYWQQKEKLPKVLTDLNDPIGGFVVPTDPENRAYIYKPGEGTSFKLCATFSREILASNTTQTTPVAPYGVIGKGVETWSHPAGEYCFDRTIDPELYPPRSKTIN